MLDFIYQTCFVPLYFAMTPSQVNRRKSPRVNAPLTFSQRALAKSNSSLNSLLGKYDDSFANVKPLKLELAVSLLFDYFNSMLFTDKEDTSRSHFSIQKHRDCEILSNLNVLYCMEQFMAPNVSFKALLMVCSPDEIIKLFSCLLTERKLVLIAPDNSFQEILAPVIEALLNLFEPLDSQVFTNVSYILNEDMVLYMEKPGNIILGMP